MEGMRELHLCLGVTSPTLILLLRTDKDRYILCEGLKLSDGELMHHGWSPILRGTDIWSLNNGSGMQPIMQHCETNPPLSGDEIQGGYYIHTD